MDSKCVRDVMTDFCLANGFDGLFQAGGCCCRLENLMPDDGCFDFNAGICETGHLSPGDDEADFYIG